jgi:hypothetical protein
MNTPETLTDDQRQQIRVFILEKLGWKIIEGESPSRDGHLIAFNPDGSTGFAPDFFASLDVCHAVAMSLNRDSLEYSDYCSRVNQAVAISNSQTNARPIQAIDAPKETRALALFLTLGGVL